MPHRRTRPATIVSLLLLAPFTALFAAAETLPVSLAAPGLAGPLAVGASGGAAVSADGRWVAFTSSAIALAPGQADGNQMEDVFLHDRTTGTTILVSHGAGSSTVAANEVSGHPLVSADGRYVAFESRATNLVPGQTDWTGAPYLLNYDVFLYDRVTGVTTLVTGGYTYPESATDLDHRLLALSADGGTLIFLSPSPNVTPGQEDISAFDPDPEDVFLWDRATGTATLLSHVAGSPTTAGNGCAPTAAVSADGSFTVFACDAGTLVPGGSDGNGVNDVFLYDRAAGTVSLISRSAGSATTAASSASYDPQISDDGAFISFLSEATNLVTGQSDAAGTTDVFLHDRAAGTAVLVSHGAGSAVTAAGGSEHALSAGGGWVAFASEGSGLVAGQVDTNAAADIFLYERAGGTTSLVSRIPGSTVTTAAGASTEPSITSDGAFVVFASTAADLVAGQIDLNGDSDVFLFDRAAGATRLVSRTAASPVTAGDGASYGGIATGGASVWLETYATDLGADLADLNGDGDIFVYDRTAQTNAAVSLRAAPTPATPDGPSTVESMSADGLWVAFLSSGTNLIAGQDDRNGDGADVFLYERGSGTRTLVSHALGAPAVTGNGPSASPVLSADGRFLAFLSQARDLTVGSPGTLGLGEDVYLHDRTAGTTVLVSHVAGSAQAPGGGAYGRPAVSADGRWIAWSSTAAHLVPGQTDTNGEGDVFLYDRLTGTSTLVSRSSAAAATAGNGVSDSPSISADGRYVAFLSRATNLVPGQADFNTNQPSPSHPFAGRDIFLYDRVTGTTVLVSHDKSSPTTAGNYFSTGAVVSAGGRWIAYASASSNLVSQPHDTFVDLFLYDRVTGTSTMASHQAGAPQSPSIASPTQISISGDGRFIAYLAVALNLFTPPDSTFQTGNLYGAVLYDRETDTNSLLSHVDGSPLKNGDGESEWIQISTDGSHVVFASGGSDLLAGQTDGNGAADVFLFNRTSGVLTLLSGSGGAPLTAAGGRSSRPLLSADGRFVAYESSSPDLLAGDWNDQTDVFLYSTEQGTSFFTLTPCRVLDTRQPGQGPALTSDVAEVWTLHGQCGIPETARAVVVNVTITQPTGVGHLTLYAGDAAAPLASTINFTPGQTRANNAVLPLAASGDGTLGARAFVNGGGTVHVLLDVTGYFE